MDQIKGKFEKGGKFEKFGWWFNRCFDGFDLMFGITMVCLGLVMMGGKCPAEPMLSTYVMGNFY